MYITKSGDDHQHVHRYYFGTTYKTIAVRAASRYIRLTSSRSGDMLSNIHRVSLGVRSVGLVAIFVIKYPQTSSPL